mgnify:CR=1 FL=1
MPVGRHRKPFSNKQKKEQLQAKRERKRNSKNNGDDSSDDNSSSHHELEHELKKSNEQLKSMNINAQAAKNVAIKLINYQPSKEQPTSSGRQAYNPNRFNLQFLKESAEQLKKYKKDASRALEKRGGESELEIDTDQVYKPASPLDIPLRPAWSYELSREQLEQQERTCFAGYLEKIFENYKDQELSYFEMNLETWRQLWRVLEISDIILLIVDIRFPSLHFSPVFYDACINRYKKDVILVLNKIDLVSTSVVIAWKAFFEQRYPHLHILLFSSSKQIKHRKRRVDKSGETVEESLDDEQAAIMAMAADIYTARAHRQLFECVSKIVDKRVDLASWDQMTDERLKRTLTFEQQRHGEEEKEPEVSSEDAAHMDELINSKRERKRFEQGFVTIGCCGFPNVGKSSLLNSLNGRKVVSVSRTPGHTKHLQTIFLTKSVRLCDCPGLVFPSLINKQLQILAGIYPIAQLQEPYSSIRYLAERVAIVDTLKLKHPSSSADDERDGRVVEWTPLDVCEAWAIKRGYYTAKASRPDVYRAANELLRMALDGRLCLSLKPKGYYANLDMWSNHADTKKLNDVVANVQQTCKSNAQDYLSSRRKTHSDDEDEEESNFEDKDPLATESDQNESKESDDDDDDDEYENENKNKFSLLTADD